MEASMSLEEVVQQITHLAQSAGEAPRKKQVKKSNPELMRNALYYFPNWDAALEQSAKHA
ncbi:hypothetical protein [Pseudalkalibacillus berkeleyi]|uniref:Uncharacterized protein n=1 Tax=Pseudalkalibacillus berkeleyi TaxID=1069813 RepID=A0ABS9GUI3_9BACL|nr:hypothetical protein [Pseudalkalibacillus berkeleyi]MCF6136502.1 hypothetical protein [Pseudalkalibacillus berkeleyi]